MLKTDADADFKIRILRNTPLFSSAPDDDLAELARIGKVTAYQHGKLLAKEGQDGAQIHFLQSGVAAELLVEPGAEYAILVGLHGPGGVAGAVGALARKAGSRGEAPETAGRRIEALSNVQALTAPAAEVLRICRRNPELSLNLAQFVAGQHDDLSRIYARSTHHSLEMRLAAFFSHLAQLCATEDWNPVSNIGRLSQSAVAAMLGVSREHVNRTLAIWERSGLIFQNKKGDILIQNARRLERLAETHGDRSAGDRQEDWLWEIDAHLDRGLNQTALHLALEAAKRAPKDLRYMHKAVLATARMGALSEAVALIDKHKLGRDLADEELACLRPRLQRDLAYAENPSNPNRKTLEASAREYERVYEKTRGFYPGVNAAAGFALAGEREKAKAIAAEVASALSRSTSDEDTPDAYWRKTTLAECKLIQGDKAGAASLFEAASNAEDATPGKKSTTRKQLLRLADPTGIDRLWIDCVTPQSDVLFFCGPLAREAVDDRTLPIDRLRKELDSLLAERSVGWAYGALASGADIVIAEGLIAAGVELNVYLPLPPQEFLKFSVHIGGPAWRDRFVKCMRAASSIEWNRRATIPCNATYKLGAEVTMGKAARHAAQLETSAVGFFAVPDDRGPQDSLSIASAVRWRSRGFLAREAKDRWPPKVNGPANKFDAEHELYFALVAHAEQGAKPLKVSGSNRAHAIRDPETGVDLVLFKSLAEALEAVEQQAKAGAARSWRLWLDAGVFTADMIEKRPAVAAAQLVSSACMPLTDPGKVYASEPFACAAPLAGPTAASFEYVGFVPTREKLDPCAMYLVRF
jgi:CRP-like cAMP-binding protein